MKSKRAGGQANNEKEERINRLYRKDWNPRRVLAGYFSVYITEGMVRSIMYILPIYLISGLFNLTPVEIGFILVMAYVPWHFKFLIGMGMDASPGIGRWRRRIYIVLGTLVTVAGVLWLGGATDVWLGILPAIILVMGGDALIDTGMDSLLLDVTPPDWHGRGIGVGWGARAIGYTISLVLTLFVQAAFGWAAVFYLFALYALPALLAVFIHEPAVTEERRVAKKPLAETFTDRRVLGWVAFSFFGAFVYIPAARNWS
jgi:dipeptide/tripeptide permease